MTRQEFIAKYGEISSAPTTEREWIKMFYDYFACDYFACGDFAESMYDAAEEAMVKVILANNAGGYTVHAITLKNHVYITDTAAPKILTAVNKRDEKALVEWLRGIEDTSTWTEYKGTDEDWEEERTAGEIVAMWL